MQQVESIEDGERFSRSHIFEKDKIIFNNTELMRIEAAKKLKLEMK